MKTYLRGHRLMSHMCCSCEHILPPPQWRGRTVFPSCTCGLKSPLPLGLGDSPPPFQDSSSVHCTCMYLRINSVWGGQEERDSPVGSGLHLVSCRTSHHLVSWACPPCLGGQVSSQGCWVSAHWSGRWLQEADSISWRCGRATNL